MLLIALAVLLVAWSAVAMIIVGLCASAAAGDRALVRVTRRGRTSRLSRTHLSSVA